MLKNEKGLTLIEVLASVAILSIVVLAYINISDYTLLANHKSSKSVEALRIAEEQLNLARENFRVNQTIPTNKIVDAYKVIFQINNLPNSGAYDTTEYESNHVSLQGIIAENSETRLLTVTVSWSD